MEIPQAIVNAILAVQAAAATASATQERVALEQQELNAAISARNAAATAILEAKAVAKQLIDQL